MEHVRIVSQGMQYCKEGEGCRSARLPASRPVKLRVRWGLKCAAAREKKSSPPGCFFKGRAVLGSIHKFTINGKNLVFDVESGALHEFDAAAWQALALLEAGLDEAAVIKAMHPSFGADAAAGALAEINKLKDEGLLWSEPRRPAAGMEPRVKALCLFLAEDCNLRCRYCFVEGGRRPPARAHMSETVGRAAIDFLIHVSGPRGHCEVDYFGGEPVLNFSALQEITAYGRSAFAAAGRDRPLP